MNIRRAPNINQLWANLMVDHLVRHGADQFVLSPGSRCTPVTAAVAFRDDVGAVRHFDERGAAFFALGYARAAGKPATLVCTSGTATANYFPAIVEASMDRLPMVVLTADRPADLRGTGANQTIDQAELYGKYVRYFADLPCPDKQLTAETVIKAIDDAMRQALGSPPGPVHINCQFDEPLAPLGPDEDFAEYISNVRDSSGSAYPSEPAVHPENRVSSDTIDRIANVLNADNNGLIVAGALTGRSEAGAVVSLAEKLGWPIFADVRSGLRLGAKSANVVAYFDQLLLSERFRKLPVMTILHLGGVMISKRFNAWVSSRQIQRYIHVVDRPFRHDPNNVVTDRIESGIADFCGRMEAKVSEDVGPEYRGWMKQVDNAASSLIDEFVKADAGVCEISIARLVSRHMAGDHGLFLGCSMPVRDMDMYGDASVQTLMVTANRGASGIDGTIATAAGLAHGLEAPVTAVVGDLAFLHDVNSLPLVKAGKWPVTLIVVNNNGGGIFSFLPVRECTHIFEDYFGTPHNLSVEKMVAAFEIDYHRPTGREQFVETYHRAQESGRSSVIEILTDREQSYQLHQSLQAKIEKAVDSLRE